MPTSYESALMSYLSYEFVTDYQEEARKKTGFLMGKQGALKEVFKQTYTFQQNTYLFQFVNYLQQRNWKYYKAEIGDVLFGYHCVVFINHEKKEIVMAHRGTVTEDNKGAICNIKDDIEILKGADGEVPGVLSLAIHFMVGIVRERSKKYSDYIIHHTGHSLGGFISECCAAYLAQPSQTFPKKNINPAQDYWMRLNIARPKDANAITFDSLGSSNILEKIGCSAANTKIINYLPQPNIANTANPHAGERRLICYQNDIPISANGHHRSVNWSSNNPLNIHEEFFDTMSSHSLEKIITAFNPETGQPFIEKIIEQWPTAINTFITSTNMVVPRYQSQTNLSILQGLFVTVATSYASLEAQRKTGGVTEFTHVRSGTVSLQELPSLNNSFLPPLPQVNHFPSINNEGS